MDIQWRKLSPTEKDLMIKRKTPHTKVIKFLLGFWLGFGVFALIGMTISGIQEYIAEPSPFTIMSTLMGFPFIYLTLIFAPMKILKYNMKPMNALKTETAMISEMKCYSKSIGRTNEGAAHPTDSSRSTRAIYRIIVLVDGREVKIDTDRDIWDHTMPEDTIYVVKYPDFKGYELLPKYQMY